jgi:two-component system cell cycle response regulator
VNHYQYDRAPSSDCPVGSTEGLAVPGKCANPMQPPVKFQAQSTEETTWGPVANPMGGKETGLSLQSRLFLFFTITVVLPLGVAGFLSQHAVSSALQGKDRDRVAYAAPGVSGIYTEQIESVPIAASTIAQDPVFRTALVSGDTTGLESVLHADLGKGPDPLDFAVVANPQGQPIAQVLGSPAYLPGVAAPTVAQLLTDASTGMSGVTGATGAGGPGSSLEVSEAIVPVVTGSPAVPVGTLVTGVYLDGNLASGLAKSARSDVTIVVGGQAIASSLSPPLGSTSPWMVRVAPAGNNPVQTTIGGRTVDAIAMPLVQGVPARNAALVASTQLTSQKASRTLVASILLVLVLAAIGAALLGFAVARAIARPLKELADGADAISAGRYDSQISVRSADEVGQLATAFNEMTDRLRAHVAELQESREELKRSLTRFGETLRSTHDLDKILNVVLDTSIDALRATGGVLLVVNPEGPFTGQLTVAASRGVDGERLVLREGEGIAGAVAHSGERILVPETPPADGSRTVPVVPEPAPGEPPFTTAVWVPVFAQGRIFAVLAVFDREDGGVFAPGDLDTVLSLADQAGVAIDNVVLHEEAQRLAITDGMTGIWNHRYFQLRFDQEMDRSARFRRPFCLLLCDIDDFKVVNDTQGHLVGDAVLIELARRIRSEVRDIDVLARYGGEEFVLILPETDADGGLRAAEKIRRRICDAPFGRDRQIPVTISIGIACFPRAGTDQTALLRAADVALYEAKARGKDRTVVYLPAEEGRTSQVG